MAPMRHKIDPQRDGPEAWLGIAKLLGLVLMVALFYLLGRSMVQHHFFTGGAQNYHNSPTGP